MQTECSPELLDFAPVEGRDVVADFDGGAITLGCRRAAARAVRPGDPADRTVRGLLRRRTRRRS